MMVSVGVTIYRRRHAIPVSAPVSAEVTDAELASCLEELQDVSVALRKYLERSHHLLGEYDSADAQRSEIQRWAEEGEIWRAQWVVLGRRCHFGEVRPARARKEQEAMAAVYEDLGTIQATYTDELKRFGREMMPRLDRIKERLEKIGDGFLPSPSHAGEKE